MNETLRFGATSPMMVTASFSHIGVFDNYYYTAAVYDTSGKSCLVLQNPSGNMMSREIEVPYTNAQTGGYSGILTQGQTYKAYVFISSHNYNTVVTSAVIRQCLVMVTRLLMQARSGLRSMLTARSMALSSTGRLTCMVRAINTHSLFT